MNGLKIDTTTNDEQWEARRQQLRELEWSCSQRLFGLAGVVLQRLEQEECKAKEDSQNVLKIAECASKLGRLSLGGADAALAGSVRDELGEELSAMIAKVAATMDGDNGGAL
jgi:hypothetical protein